MTKFFRHRTRQNQWTIGPRIAGQSFAGQSFAGGVAPGRFGRVVVIAGLIVGGYLLTLSGSALAELDPGATEPSNATGPCSAHANVDGGFTIDPYVSSGIYEIPLAGSASYVGTVEVPETERPISGNVVILTPPFIPDITLTDRWDWDDPAIDISASGNVDWDLPEALPRGIPLTVQGRHTDSGIVCEGSVQVQIEGGLWDSPVLPLSLGGTAVAAAGLGWAIRPKGAA